MTDSTRQEQPPLEIALVGAGVCGLTCALALAKFGIPVQVFEAAVRDESFRDVCLDNELPLQSNFKEIGAGIGLGMSGLEFMPLVARC